MIVVLGTSNRRTFFRLSRTYLYAITYSGNAEEFCEFTTNVRCETSAINGQVDFFFILGTTASVAPFCVCSASSVLPVGILAATGCIRGHLCRARHLLERLNPARACFTARPLFFAARRPPITGSHMVTTVVVVGGVVLTLTHQYDAVRGHRTGSNNSGAEDYLKKKNEQKTEDDTHNN